VTEYDIEADDMMNPGIKETVKLLRELGFDTCDSGDGATHLCECDAPVPYVHIKVSRAQLCDEADRLREIIESRAGATIWTREMADPIGEEGETYNPSIQASYVPHDGHSLISMYGITDADLFAPKSMVN
jgi:hypothetical protein